MQRVLAGWMLAAVVGGAIAAERLPIDSFFENPSFTAARLSPSGKFVAVRLGAPDQRQRLAVVDLAASKVTVIAGYPDADINSFDWISDERLVYDLDDSKVAQGDVEDGPGLFAVNRDGSAGRALAHTSVNPYREMNGGGVSLLRLETNHQLPWNTVMAHQFGRQDSNTVYAYTVHYYLHELDQLRLFKVDTASGRHVAIDAPAKAQGWLLDQDGEPRIVWSREKSQTTLWYRDPAKDNQWRAIGGYDTYLPHSRAIEPFAFGPDGTLYVTTNAGHDKTALYRYDLAKGALAAAPEVQLDDFDFDGELVIGSGKLLGIRFVADARATAWLDPAMQKLQAEIDAQLRGTANRVDVPLRPETPWLLVTSSSDRQPRVFRMYNTQTKQFMLLGESRPRIKAAQMGREELVQVKARDGLRLPAWLTTPAGMPRKNLPMVVLVHGGPWVRGNVWGWNADAQFLASRGYAVLEPEFRGSTGYGDALFRAGLKQWGLTMQDDVADVTRWAIAQGIADGKRICIAGASYGGYATLMGLVRDPDLYKCGVAWAGVTDIGLMFNGHWSALDDLSNNYRSWGFPRLVGDPVQDAEQSKATSPIEQAARITQPLLLAYGGADYRVPIYHGRKFRDAVQATNKQVEWVEYPEEGHGWFLPKNRIDFWTRVEQFLDRHIGH